MANFSVSRVQKLIDLLAPSRLTRIMDVGANPVNEAPYSGLLAMGGCEIWGFEPQQDAYQALIDRARDSEHYYPHAIGDGKKHTLYVCQSDGFTSLLPPNEDTIEFLDRWRGALTVVDEIPIKTKRLDDIEDLPRPDLFKIDVQGGEAMIFKHAQATLSEAVAVISEVAFVPVYEGQPLFHEQAKLLEGYGFHLSKFDFLKQKSVGSTLMTHLNWRKHQGQLIDGDAVFVKTKRGLKDLNAEQLKHLAICADAVFESFDLCVKCLTILLEREVIKETATLDYVADIPFQKGA